MKLNWSTKRKEKGEERKEKGEGRKEKGEERREEKGEGKGEGRRNVPDSGLIVIMILQSYWFEDVMTGSSNLSSGILSHQQRREKREGRREKGEEKREGRR